MFNPAAQKRFEGTIRGPVLGAALPGVATALGATAIGAGTYHLSQGEYDKALAAYGTALEVLPNVSPNYILTPTQAVKLEAQVIEREMAEALVVQQRAAASAAADDFAGFITDKVVADVSGKQAAREVGPVASAVLDTTSGHIEMGLNIHRGRGLAPTAAEMQQLNEMLPAVLKTRLKELETHLAELERTGQITAELADKIKRAGTPAAHAEVIALAKAINAREAATGVAVTEQQLGEFMFANRGLEGALRGQSVPPPCYFCEYLIQGTKAAQ